MIFISVFGWMIAAVVVVWFFVFSKPVYERAAAEQGIADQNAADKSAYESATGVPATNQILSDIVAMIVTSKQPGSIKGDEVSLTINNPFAEKARTFLVLYDDMTRIVRRIPLSTQEYQRRIKAATQKGENPLLIPPFDDTPTDINDIQPGDRLEVVLRDPNALNAQSFMANEIAITLLPNLDPASLR